MAARFGPARGEGKEDIRVIVEERGPFGFAQDRLAVPVAVESERHLRAQDVAQAFGVAGAFLLHEGRLAGVDAKQAQDAAPGHRLAAEAA
jgi:hypothetical protein